MLPKNKRQIGAVKKVILVAAGKGGVGKSTVSYLIAKQLQEKGFRVGILDADIYGPSIPTLLGAEDQLPKIEQGMFIPIDACGISLMSIGFLVKPQSAIAWRGPMLSKALNQMLFSSKWEELDYLIVDMPPGTGDIHLSIVQKCKIDGAIIVSTPDEIAIRDVERAIDLYQKMHVPILGIVENMSYLEVLGQKIFPFGTGKTKLMAEKFGIKILKTLPLIPELQANPKLYNLPNLQIGFE